MRLMVSLQDEPARVLVETNFVLAAAATPFRGFARVAPGRQFFETADQTPLPLVGADNFAVYHSYAESAPARRLAAVTQSMRARYGKPVLVGEAGVASPRPPEAGGVSCGVRRGASRGGALVSGHRPLVEAPGFCRTGTDSLVTFGAPVPSAGTLRDRLGGCSSQANPRQRGQEITDEQVKKWETLQAENRNRGQDRGRGAGGGGGAGGSGGGAGANRRN